MSSEDTFEEPVPQVKEEPKGPTGPVGPPGPDGEIVISKEDRLEAENLALRVQLITMQRTQLMDDANKRIIQVSEELTKLNATIKTTQKYLSEKYGVDFATHHIEAGTGRVIPVK